ncbi:hypothetical protein [Dyadobacter jiangsuensis]|uniref:Type VI secretion system (T6SS) VasB/ImpH family protein n=1 Tax=Dyadobacter jiangsuensis TaxID=1591085 RepID=A0A2P8G0D3_9BACT|nr:hypothetical protein [Dyadobacter jiangsuensis]PSL27426.1 type VI secretion system (T6SS) VasB/ImpH family protein [Dyadobacter jiangsuensis]
MASESQIVSEPDKLATKLKAGKEEIECLGKNHVAGDPVLDLRLEVILAELSSHGLDPLRDVLVHTWSLFERDYRGDLDLNSNRVVVGDARALDLEKKRAKVGDSSTIESRHGKPEWDYYDLMQQNLFLNLVVHRDGLYDYLPEGLFHQPVNSTRDRDHADLVNEIAVQFEREHAARRFFQPIEQEFYLQRLLLEFEERKYLITEENLRRNDSGEIFRAFWQLPEKLLSIRQLNNLLHLLPITHRIVGDIKMVTETFELILGVPVELSVLPPISFPIIEQSVKETPEDNWIGPEPSDLGRLSLGTFSLGGIYQDTMPALEVRVGPLTTNQFAGFLPGARERRILDLLQGYFIPAETTVITHLLPDEGNIFKLDGSESASVLGFNAYMVAWPIKA